MQSKCLGKRGCCKQGAGVCKVTACDTQAAQGLADCVHRQQAQAHLITSSALSGAGARHEAARCAGGRQPLQLPAVALCLFVCGGELVETGLLHGP